VNMVTRPWMFHWPRHPHSEVTGIAMPRELGRYWTSPYELAGSWNCQLALRRGSPMWNYPSARNVLNESQVCSMKIAKLLVVAQLENT
jgi:hypothetical protein